MTPNQAKRITQLETRNATILALVELAKEMVDERNPAIVDDVETLAKQIPQWAQVAAVYGHDRTLTNVRFCEFLTGLGRHGEYIASYIQEVEDASEDKYDDLLHVLWDASYISYALSNDDDDYEGDEDESPRRTVEELMNDMISKIN